MERYEAYKDSGVERVGKIPEGWHFGKITSIIDRSHPYAMGDGDHGTIKVESYLETGIPFIRVQNLGWGTELNLDNLVYISEADNEPICNSTLRPGDILFAKTGTIGKTSIVPESMPISNTTSHVGKITVSEHHYSRFYLYVLASTVGYTQLWAIASQKTTRPELSIDETKSLIVPIPSSKSEEKAIADYLDAKTAEIDALVADCEREVELLREYRKAVISEAVTKGLDPDAPMKDSGVEWVGERPVSWRYLKLGYVFDRLFDIDHWMPESIDEGYPYVMISDLAPIASKIEFSSCKHICEEDYLRLSLKGVPKRGDVIIARYATIGTGCFVDSDEKFIVSYACLTVTPQAGVLRGRYLLYYTQADVFGQELYMVTNSNTQGNVGKDSLSKAHILLPPIEEQDAIISYLDAKTAEIDSLIKLKQQMAEKLREYRKSLISEAVTGKFKVPGVK